LHQFAKSIFSLSSSQKITLENDDFFFIPNDSCARNMNDDSAPPATKRRRKLNKTTTTPSYARERNKPPSSRFHRREKTTTSTVTTRQRACHLLRQHEFDVHCPLFSTQLTRDCATLILKRVSARDLARVKSSCKFFGDERGRGRAMIEEEVRARIERIGLTTDMPEHFW
jgi:hypothetical protein